MCWKRGGDSPLDTEALCQTPPLQGAQPMPMYCLPDGKRRLQWHLSRQSPGDDLTIVHGSGVLACRGIQAGPARPPSRVTAEVGCGACGTWHTGDNAHAKQRQKVVGAHRGP